MLRQWTLAIGLSLPFAVGAAGNPHPAWHSVGPAPPAVEAAVASDPGSHTIYVGTLGGGVYKSTNDGATFAPVNNDLGDDFPVLAMVMDPHNPDVVYVAGGKTIDGGAHWFGTDIGGVTMVIDPNNPNIVYAGGSPSGGIFKTTDGGQTSFPALKGLGVGAVFALAIDPKHSSVLYAGTQGGGAYKSTNGAASWKHLKIDPTVSALLVDPDNSNIVYAGTNGHGVFKSTNAGATFARVGSPTVGVILALAKSGQTLYAGTATQGVSESNDGGKTWTNTQLTKGSAIVLSVDSAGSVLVGTNFEGAFIRRVSDTGWRRLAWNKLQQCACQNGHAIAVDPGDSNHVFYTTNGSMLETHDGGHHWNEAGTDGLTALAPRGVAFDPADPRHVYTGSFEAGGLFKSDDNGQHWQRRLFGSTHIYVTGISVDPVDHSVYAATINSGGGGEIDGIWKSTDFGQTFTRIDRAPGATPGEYIGLGGRTITVDPHRHRTIYFADNTDHPGVWRSQDAGHSWSQVDAADPGGTLSVTVDPTDSNIVYASAYTLGVLKSVDGGATFVRKSHGLPDEENTARTGSLQVNPERPSVLYVGMIGDGVFKSTDGAETWFPINAGLDTENSRVVTGLAMDPNSPNTLYIATYASVYKRVAGDR
jgi:photosystem II stability/assembly factor-like uncharacterized protein